MVGNADKDGKSGKINFLDTVNWAALVLVVGATVYAIILSHDTTVTEAMYLHGLLNVGAFGVLISLGIAKQIVLTLKYWIDTKKGKPVKVWTEEEKEAYSEKHKKRHTFVNALAMVPAYAALYIGQRARNGQHLSLVNDVLALCLAGLVVLNFCVGVLENPSSVLAKKFLIIPKNRLTAFLAWSTGVLSLISTIYLIADNPGPNVTHHYLGITTVFMYQLLILRFFVKYGYESYNTLKETVTLSQYAAGLFKIAFVPVYVCYGFAGIFEKEDKKAQETPNNKIVLKYNDHIIWGFATLGVSIAAIVTGIALYGEWYRQGDHETSLYAVMGGGLGSLVLAIFLRLCVKPRS